MKTFFTKAILILLLAAAAVPCLAQQNGTVSFSYDANGNRIARTLLFQRGDGKGRGDTEHTAAAPLLATATDTLAGLELALYPNPTDGQFSVGVGNAVEGTRLEAVLCTPAGAVISRKTLAGESIGFDLSGHAAGVYLLRIEDGSETRIWKVIKH